jgi:hypothetical protein
MKRSCVKAGLAAAALGALLAGCATTVEMGPGYYHWDTHAVDLKTPTATASEPKVAYDAHSPVIKETAPAEPAIQVAPAQGTPVR